MDTGDVKMDEEYVEKIKLIKGIYLKRVLYGLKAKK